MAEPGGVTARMSLTPRGVGMLACGVVIGAGGVGLSAPVMVYVGVAMTCAVALAWIWMTTGLASFTHRFPYAERTIVPRPLTVGVPGSVTVTIRARRARRGSARGLIARLQVREQAAAELTGGAATRAAVTRTADALTLAYSLSPVRRGRWDVGPALLHASDPLGMLLSDTSFGTAESVSVWPRVVDLTGTAGALLGQADRVVLGARTPSTDDAALREYREGDDLRRVHWASSARRGTMLVRSDEHAGRRPATVILDLPHGHEALEWSVSAAASIGVSVLDTGHPVRLLHGGPPGAAAHLGQRGGDVARAELLDQTVDLASPASRAAAEASLLRSAAAAAEGALEGEVTVAIIDPPSDQALAALAPIGATGRAWAILRAAAEGDREVAQGAATRLRKAGWRCTVVGTGDDIAEVWNTLLTMDDLA
ncbi:DUF58 domain-containing protein [Demequina sp. NBRC 110057]|uniref:DUF58 domain-containing protein n=1 Tax=Demequina sp. NBRC 110057 TaxID=1570346 RepID=UPI0009FEA632|nr:DUF58 domain-containing protein [Demequina sp. NBRC 110057]